MDRGIGEAGEGGAGIDRASTDDLRPFRRERRRIKRIRHRNLVRRGREIGEALGAARSREIAVGAVLAQREADEGEVGDGHLRRLHGQSAACGQDRIGCPGQDGRIVRVVALDLEARRQDRRLAADLDPVARRAIDLDAVVGLRFHEQVAADMHGSDRVAGCDGAALQVDIADDIASAGEHAIGVHDDIAGQLAVDGKSAAIDPRPAGGIGAGQADPAAVVFGERARPGQIAGIGAVGELREQHRRVVEDVTLQAAGGAHQRAALDRGAAGIAVRPGEGQPSPACLDHTAEA